MTDDPYPDTATLAGVTDEERARTFTAWMTAKTASRELPPTLAGAR